MLFSFIPCFEKSECSDVVPECDPLKYDPFPPDDPVCGIEKGAASGHRALPLGRLQPSGENGLPTAPIGLFINLRCDPFFFYVGKRVVEEVDALLPKEEVSLG